MTDRKRFLNSYCVATGAGKRPRHIRHVLQNANEGTAMCGRSRVRFVGLVAQPFDENWPWCDENWPWCDECVAVAGPEIMSTWIEGGRESDGSE